ncbi:MAG: hypothetical protein JRI36_08220, partial [Deltaproteobacteria bacterium]|nr:hypothetical protein [Deltaproteobacteria bacterium]
KCGGHSAEDNKSFQNVLEGTLHTAGQQATKVSPAVSDQKIVPVALQGLSAERARVFKKASNLLVLLEKYQNALRDHTQTLRSIEPLVHDIRAEAEGIEAVEDPGDDRLSRLAQDIATTAVVNALKFERGDYVE